MVLRESDIFIHIECDDVLEPISSCKKGHDYNARTHDNFPSFTILIKALYVGTGEEPVGNPRTKGLSGVGANSLILHGSYD